MGRHRAGPIRKGGGATYYARLTVPPELRARAGKTRLIRSLGTTNHGEALKRYGAVYTALEQELAALLAGDALRQKVSLATQPAFTPDGVDLPPAEKAALLLNTKELDENNAEHVAVFEAIKNQQPLAVTWDEGLATWQTERNRVKSRPLSKSSIYCTTKAVNSIRSYGEPHQITKQIIRQWIVDHEKQFSTTTVAGNFRLISSVVQCMVDTDELPSNPFKSISYTATVNKEDERRAFTDDELVKLSTEVPVLYWLCLTGMRPGEFASRLASDIDGDMLVIDEQPTLSWRPKTLSSYRRVPMPPGMELDTSKLKVQSRISRMGFDLRDRVTTDKTATPHSARHTFYELSRRADCDQRVIEVLTGHAKVSGSRSARNYGSMPDEVLKREIQKVWDFAAGLHV